MRAHATSCYEGGRTSNRAALSAVPASLESSSHDALRLRLAAGGVTGSAPIATTETTAGEGAAVAVSFATSVPEGGALVSGGAEDERTLGAAAQDFDAGTIMGDVLGTGTPVCKT
jgi:hypothetical protein